MPKKFSKVYIFCLFKCSAKKVTILEISIHSLIESFFMLILLTYLQSGRFSKMILLYISKKRYFIVDQQIARLFVQYSECLSIPLPFYGTMEIITPFLNSRISANHDKK